MKCGKVAVLFSAMAHGLAWVLLFFFAFGPVYQVVHGTESGAVRTTASLVAQNGAWVLGPLVVPIALTGLGLFAVAKRPSHLWAGRLVAWTAALLLLGFCAVSVWSIGLFYLPAALLLVASAVAASRRVRDARRLRA